MSSLPPRPPAIVLAAHSRPTELAHLCRSLLAANIAPGTPLIVSIDGGADQQAAVRAVADELRWPHGPMDIVEHEHRGLIGHFEWCGDLTAAHGSIVFLEDDLVVGPAFHQWSAAALAHGELDPRIAGVSLAAPFFDGYRHLPFEPILDGGDGLFAQIPWYDGMAWTEGMWSRFRNATIDRSTAVHHLVASLGDDEWFPDYMRYLVATDRYFLLPRHAHTTNSGAAGAHFESATDWFQVPLTLRGPTSWRLHDLDHSLAVYDDQMELAPRVIKQLVPNLDDMDFAVDLLGTRDLTTVTAPHLLTTRLTTTPLRQWGASLHPLVANLVADLEGTAITLARTRDVIDTEESDAASQATLRRHATRGRSPSNRDALRQLAGELKGRLRRDQ